MSLRFAPVLLFAGAAVHVHALGLGSTQGQAVIGQTLRIEIPLLDAGEGLSVECFSILRGADGIPSEHRLRDWHFHFETAGGAPRLVLTTATPGHQPIIEFRLAVGCGYNLQRDYSLLPVAPQALGARGQSRLAHRWRVGGWDEVAHSLESTATSSGRPSGRTDRKTGRGRAGDGERARSGGSARCAAHTRPADHSRAAGAHQGRCAEWQAGGRERSSRTRRGDTLTGVDAARARELVGQLGEMLDRQSAQQAEMVGRIGELERALAELAHLLAEGEQRAQAREAQWQQMQQLSMQPRKASENQSALARLRWRSAGGEETPDQATDGSGSGGAPASASGKASAQGVSAAEAIWQRTADTPSLEAATAFPSPVAPARAASSTAQPSAIVKPVLDFTAAMAARSPSASRGAASPSLAHGEVGTKAGESAVSARVSLPEAGNAALAGNVDVSSTAVAPIGHASFDGERSAEKAHLDAPQVMDFVLPEPAGGPGAAPEAAVISSDVPTDTATCIDVAASAGSSLLPSPAAERSTSLAGAAVEPELLLPETAIVTVPDSTRERASETLLPDSEFELPTPADQPTPQPATKAHAAEGAAEVPVSMDEALQLVDIMMSPGLVDSAAQALAEHIATSPRQSLHYWFRLLDVDRARGKREDFGYWAQQLRLSFNVDASSWESREGRSLIDYPHIVANLCACWGTAEAVVYLRRLLDDHRDGTRTGFPHPVAEEILLLIAIAADEPTEPVV